MISCLIQSDLVCLYGTLPWWFQLGLCLAAVGVLVNFAQAVMKVASWLDGWGGIPAVAGGALVLAGMLSSLWGPLVAVLKVFGPKPKKPKGQNSRDADEFAFGVDRLRPNKRPTIFDQFR
jgi:hypothetical protein